MVDKRYGIPFVAALALNLVYWGVVGDWFGHIKPPETPKKDLVINLDMGQQEPPQEKKDPEKLKIQPDDKPVAGNPRTLPAPFPAPRCRADIGCAASAAGTGGRCRAAQSGRPKAAPRPCPAGCW